jgi:hypothetical protein
VSAGAVSAAGWTQIREDDNGVYGQWSTLLMRIADDEPAAHTFEVSSTSGRMDGAMAAVYDNNGHGLTIEDDAATSGTGTSTGHTGPTVEALGDGRLAITAAACAYTGSISWNTPTGWTATWGGTTTDRLRGLRRNVNSGQLAGAALTHSGSTHDWTTQTVLIASTLDTGFAEPAAVTIAAEDLQGITDDTAIVDAAVQVAASDLRATHRPAVTAPPSTPVPLRRVTITIED